MAAASSPSLHTETPSPREAKRFLVLFMRRGIWPIWFLGVLAAIGWGLATGQQDVVRAMAATGTLGVIMLLEQLAPRHREGGVRGDAQLPNDIGLLLGNGLMEAATATAFFGVALACAAPLQSVLGFSVWPSHWGWPAQALLGFIAADLLDYGVHRASHRVPWLWSIHVHHHDTSRLHVLKGARNHPLATCVRIVGVYLPLIVLGAPVLAVFAYQVFITSIGSLSHANLDMRFPAWLHGVLVTPPVHRIHHARAPELHDRNFGAFTTLWDRLFGTYEAPVPGVDPAPGLEEGGAPTTFLAQLAWPFIFRR